MSSLATLSAKPWERYAAPDQLYVPRGMIGFEERRMLHWLAAEHYTGAGTVVDAGAYLGASAFALASGLARSRHAAAPHAVVHAYDRFVATDDYVRLDLSQGDGPVAPDFDYYPIFASQTAPCAARIVAHRGDFLAAPVPQSPIEILFIDVAKTAALNRHVVEHYFAKLIAGQSVVVHQDFYQAWYPHISATMEYLSDSLTVVDPYVDVGSRLYVLTRAIPGRDIDHLLDGLGVEEEAELLRRAIGKDRGRTRMMLRVAEILHLVDRQGRPSAARAAASALRCDPAFEPNAYYATQLEVIERHRQLA